MNINAEVLLHFDLVVRHFCAKLIQKCFVRAPKFRVGRFVLFVFVFFFFSFQGNEKVQSLLTLNETTKNQVGCCVPENGACDPTGTRCLCNKRNIIGRRCEADCSASCVNGEVYFFWFVSFCFYIVFVFVFVFCFVFVFFLFCFVF